MSAETIVIKKRSRPTARIRDRSQGPELRISREATEEPEAAVGSDEDKNLPLDDLIELRKLRRAREGIDVTKLNEGEPRKRKKEPAADDASTTTPSGLIKGPSRLEEVDEREREENKARRAVRTNNFTQQTNALDVDKHMMAYIEENLKKRRGERGEKVEEDDQPPKPHDPMEELYNFPAKVKAQTAARVQEEGSVTNSASMLTAIPEVDLGMEARLKNIEETEKAKRMLAIAKKEKSKAERDEEALASTRFYKLNLKQKSDADIIRDARLEAMGLRPHDYEPRRQHEKVQTATDEMVMERFKKRMRKG